MSYYQVESWNGTPITEMLKENKITYFVGDDNECHLRIDDGLFLGRVWLDLTEKFDVMLLERSGKKYIWLDTKNKAFKPR
jgi:hypothetical protein